MESKIYDPWTTIFSILGQKYVFFPSTPVYEHSQIQGGHQGRTPLGLNFSFSYSFWGTFSKIIGWCLHLYGWHSLLWEILDMPLITYILFTMFATSFFGMHHCNFLRKLTVEYQSIVLSTNRSISMVTDPVVMVISIRITNKEGVVSLIAPTFDCRKILID